MMEREKIIQEIKENVKVVIAGAAIAFIINNTLIVSATVPTGSMEDTIETGSRLIGSRLSYLLADPERGDIITFYCPDEPDTVYLKRVIGLPGEKIEGISGRIYINGEKIEETYIKKVFKDDFGPFVIPEDSYFVMGDNRNDSWDSRYWQNTFVSKDAITGKIKVEYYPELQVF